MEKLNIGGKSGAANSDSNDDDEDEDEDIVGPLPPKDFQQQSKQKDVGKEEKEDDESADSYDDLSDSEDEDESNAALVKRIPATHEVAMVHGTRTVLALASDPSGARIASGSIDSRYNGKFN